MGGARGYVLMLKTATREEAQEEEGEAEWTKHRLSSLAYSVP
jgi:hypothetical protein